MGRKTLLGRLESHLRNAAVTQLLGLEMYMASRSSSDLSRNITPTVIATNIDTCKQYLPRYMNVDGVMIGGLKNQRDCKGKERCHNMSGI